MLLHLDLCLLHILTLELLSQLFLSYHLPCALIKPFDQTADVPVTFRGLGFSPGFIGEQVLIEVCNLLAVVEVQLTRVARSDRKNRVEGVGDHILYTDPLVTVDEVL